MKLKRASEPISLDIVDRAAEWLVEFRVGDADAKTRERFNAWLRMSPLHIRAYLEVAGAYVGLAPRGAELHFDIDRLIQEARADQYVVSLAGRAGVPTTRSPSSSVPRIRFSRAPFAIAAALAIAVAGLYFWQQRAAEVYVTRIGEQRLLPLPDGSQLQLNARSRVRVQYGDHERRVDLLAGQALFQVAQDAHRPFTVHSAGTVIRAIGTQFDVDHRVSGTIVTVLEGRVAVSSGSASSEPSLVLATGEQLTISHKVSKKIKAANMAAATTWTRHELAFDGTPLADVVEEFNRYNSRQLVIEDRSLNEFHISGVYASPDPGSLVTFLRTEPDIVVTEKPNEVRIGRK